MSAKTSANGEIPSRIVLLISRSLFEGTGNVLYASGAASPSTTHATASGFYLTADSVPSISSNVSFATHLAVGVLDVDYWKDTNSTLQ